MGAQGSTMWRARASRALAAVLAIGVQLSSGCPVRLAFLVDGASFAQQRKFHQLARNTAFVPSGPPKHGVTALGL